MVKLLILFVIVAGIILTGLTFLKIRSDGDDPKRNGKRPPPR